ncbi:MAG: hypothetical protein ACK4ND_01260 [Cytophagaceae bacterium]
MKQLFRNLILLSIFSLLTYCKKGPEQEPPMLELSETNLGGRPFSPSMVSAGSIKDYSNGYVLTLSDGEAKVAIATPVRGEGTYTICSSCRDENNIAHASATLDNVTYNATSGKLTITVSPEGELSGSYFFHAISPLGLSITVENGVFKNVSVEDFEEEEYFKTILMSKIWAIKKYEFQDHVNPWFDLRDFYNTSIYTRVEEQYPDPCDWSGTIKSPKGTWHYYHVAFSESSLDGSFMYDLRTVDTEATNESDCDISYITVRNTDVISSEWGYDDEEDVLNTSFGELYDILDGQEEYLQMDYKITYFSFQKIVLEGSRYSEGDLIITNNITLE